MTTAKTTTVGVVLTSVAIRFAVSAEQVEMALSYSPATTLDHLVHAAAALEEARAFAERRAERLGYALRRLECAEAILAYQRMSPRKRTAALNHVVQLRLELAERGMC